MAQGTIVPHVCSTAVSAHEDHRSRLPFPVVGIGASAGGLPALKSLLAGLPATLDAALVVITHTAADVKSHLAEVLAGSTRLAVRELAGAERATPGVIHVLPSGHDLIIRDGILALVPRDVTPMSRPIDRFLRSLGRDQGPGAVGVILSGAGSDGSLGLRDIHDAGGLVIVQDPPTALHDGMPSSAIRTGLVDVVLPAESMGGYLARTLPHVCCGARGGQAETDDSVEDDAALRRILAMLLDDTGHDLTGYKQSTLMRRIRKRMLLVGDRDMECYGRRLVEDAEERGRLFGDLLIGVTAFFRDEAAFSLLANVALPSIASGLGAQDTVRAWVACCSTGEEAYSVAMLLAENKVTATHAVKLFATDIDLAALDVARKGLYPRRLAAAVGESRLARWFRCVADNCTVTPTLRESVVFAAHDLLRDPPFLGMDLIVCRNFLIYLNPELQEKVISIFSHALRPGGYLLLGPAETIGGGVAFFSTEDKKWRLYRRKSNLAGPLDLSTRLDRVARIDLPMERPHTMTGVPDPEGVAEARLLVRYGHPAVLLDPSGVVVRLVGDTTPYLELPTGAPSLSVHKLARKTVRPYLRAVLEAAMRGERECSSGPVPVDANGGGKAGLVDIKAEPVLDSNGGVSFVLVVFERLADALPAAKRDRLFADGNEIIAYYESELERAGDRLQLAVERYETLTEELKASNEELTSMNEELQSSNEELEASREELQSLNEELSSLNAELQIKIDEAAASGAFVENLLAATNLATVVLDHTLSIMRFTPAAENLFHVVSSDRDRFIGQIKTTFDAGLLLDDCRSVLADGGIVERELVNESGWNYLQRAYPFRSPGGEVAGVVLTFTDISTLKRAEAVLRRGNEELERLVDQRTEELREKVRLLDLANVMVRSIDGRITLWNTGSEMLYGYTAEEALGQVSYELLDTEFPMPLASIMEILTWEGRWSGELRKRAKDGQVVDVAVTWVLNRDAASRPISILEVGADVTERNRLEEQARRWSQVFETADFGLAYVNAEDNTLIEVNRAFANERGYTSEELAGQSSTILYTAEEWKRIRRVVDGFDATGHGVVETVHKRKDGSDLPVLVEVTVLRDAKGRTVSRVAYALDISDRIKAEEAVRDMARFPSENPNPVLRVGRDMVVSHSNGTSNVFLHSYDSGMGQRFPEAFQETMAAAFASGEIMQFEADVQGRAFVFAVCPVAGRDYANIYGMDITERQRVQKELAASESKYHGLFDSMAEGVCLLEMVRDDAGAIVDYLVLEANPSYTTILGIPRQQAVGRRVRDIFGLDAPPDLEMYSQVIATGIPAAFDTFFELQGKELQVSAFALGGDQFAVIFEDITERVRDAQELQRSEERLRLLVDSAPDAIIIQSEGRFAYLNPRAVCLFGASSAEDLLGEAIIDHIHPDSKDIVRDRIRRANAGEGGLSSVELTYLRQDGSSVPVEAVATSFEYKGRRGSLVFTRDISERKREAAEKKRQQAMTDAVARVRGTYVAGHEPGQVFEVALGALLELSGSRQGFLAELRGDERGHGVQESLATVRRSADGQRVDGEAWDEAMLSLGAAIAARRTPLYFNPLSDAAEGGAARQRRSDFYESFLGLPLLHGTECMGALGLADRPSGYGPDLVAFLRPLVDTCSQIIERLRAERRLVAAKQAAEAASLAKSEFLANMSHEIRTPLNGVLGMLQLMLTTALDTEQSEYVDNAVKSTKRLTRLLSDILDLSLVESGKLGIRNAPCAPSDLLDAVRGLFSQPAREKGLTLSVSQGRHLPARLVADEARLRQILFNLVGNAVKFTDQGLVSVDLSPASVGHDVGFHLLVTVSDSGIGIPDDDLGIIFEPFGQIEGVYVRRFGGAGLGLSIVRRLVRLMGGEIAVDSQEGRGTTFYVTLPVERVADNAATEASAPERQAAPSMRLLLAEDDAVNRLSFARMLEKAGHRVDTVEDGQRALTLLAEGDYDCILMDVQMPVMDGVAATKAIRGDASLGEKARIPIIAMTAYAMAGDRERLLEAGMDDYVGKPVDIQELEAALKRVRETRSPLPDNASVALPG